MKTNLFLRPRSSAADVLNPNYDTTFGHGDTAGFTTASTILGADSKLE